MKYIFSILLFVSLAMAIQPGYWQQEVHYDINVKLNDSLHTLVGTETIEYINNSPDTLDFIWMHLWPNAYKNDASALAKQKIKFNSTRFAFAPDSTRGYIDIENVMIDSSQIKWQYRSDDTLDVALFYLNKPLFPNDSIQISMDFITKIPVSMSRLGHVGNHYEVTQWYPKPAVYDMTGWCPMSYLDIGEFYSEWGSFDVKITVPDNYRVASTGILHDKAEINWLDSLAQEGNIFIDTLITNKEATIDALEDKIAIQNPTTSDTYKTLRFTQNNVHDFAWFADKRYIVSKKWYHEKTTDDSIATWLFIIPRNLANFRKGHTFISEALEGYGKYFMPYPYSHCTVVDGDFSAGGGMEYPMITVINNSSDEKWMETVIIHEVGHNWFYGFSGSNERAFPWQDEGLNSYGENRTIMRFHGEGAFYKRRLHIPYIGDYFQKFAEAPDLMVRESRGYFRMALMDNDQAGHLHSEEYVRENYWAIVYGKVAHVTYLLEKYLGETMMDSAFHTYFDEWGYRHPQPNDMREVFERVTNKDLSWYFDVLIGSNAKLDFALSDVSFDTKKGETTIKLKNNGEAGIPLPLFLISENDTIIKWIDSFDKDKTIKVWTEEPLKSVIIDPKHWILDINRKNNQLHVKPEFHTLKYIYNPGDRYSINFLPYPALSSIDFIKPGILAFHHNRLQWDASWHIALNYGFVSQTPSITSEWKSQYSKYGNHMGQFKFNGQANYISNMVKLSFTYLTSKDISYQMVTHSTELLKDAEETFNLDSSLYSPGRVSYAEFAKHANYQSAFVHKSSKWMFGLGYFGEKSSLFLKSQFNWDYQKQLNRNLLFSYDFEMAGTVALSGNQSDIPSQYLDYVSTSTDPTFENIFILSRSANNFLSPGEGMTYGHLYLPGFIGESRNKIKAIIANSITIDLGPKSIAQPYLGFGYTINGNDEFSFLHVASLKFNKGPFEIYYPLVTDVKNVNIETLKAIQINLTMTQLEMPF